MSEIRKEGGGWVLQFFGMGLVVVVDEAAMGG